MNNWKKFIAKILIEILVYFLEEKKNTDVEAKAELTAEQSLFLQDVSKLIAYAHTFDGVILTAGEMFRTNEQQAIYIAKGLTKTKVSQHQKRLAVDFNLIKDGKFITDREPYKFLADYWKSLSPKNRAGFDWGWDANHFERTI